jgi:hypothetical protein
VYICFDFLLSTFSLAKTPLEVKTDFQFLLLFLIYGWAFIQGTAAVCVGFYSNKTSFDAQVSGISHSYPSVRSVMEKC